VRFGADFGITNGIAVFWIHLNCGMIILRNRLRRTTWFLRRFCITYSFLRKFWGASFASEIAS
jgi:hypothetical protein